ncbi:MAG: hypothetical protein KA536_15185 [Saprospiraceae bacterium]|nr:hypothetical protein [Saprospiraceae bacterium]
MYKSKEIRWFKDSSDQAILDWFASGEQTFNDTESRTDYYLPLDKDDISVKLREGNIEIKHRIGETTKGKLTEATGGVFEHWIKWSFNADKADKLSQIIVSSNPHGWTETIKTRIGVKVTEDTDGVFQVLPIKSFVDFGCQIEYTQLQINGKTSYTFAFEWFGEKELKLPDYLLAEILSHSQLKIEDSMGYGKYIRIIK